MRQHAEGSHHREGSPWGDCADQEGSAGASHQMHHVRDNHVNVLRVSEQGRSAQVREVLNVPHERAL